MANGLEVKSQGRLVVRAILAVIGVTLVSAFHAWWSLLACDDESSSDRWWGERCWSYEIYPPGWHTAAAVVFLLPIGLSIAGGALAVSRRSQTILAAAFAFSLALAVGGFLAAPLLFG